MRVVQNSSGRAQAVRILTAHGWRRFPGQAIRKKFQLGSTDFDVHVLRLDPPRAAWYGSRARVTGFARGLGRARLQELTPVGWQVVRRLRLGADGRFAVGVDALSSTELRLAYNGVTGDAVALRVLPRMSVTTRGSLLHALVRPWLPLQVERLTHRHWRTVARARGVYDAHLRPGSYRVTVDGGTRYENEISRPVSLRADT
jgi:hypothetical protein